MHTLAVQFFFFSTGLSMPHHADRHSSYNRSHKIFECSSLVRFVNGKTSKFIFTFKLRFDHSNSIRCTLYVNQFNVKYNFFFLSLISLHTLLHIKLWEFFHSRCVSVSTKNVITYFENQSTKFRTNSDFGSINSLN